MHNRFRKSLSLPIVLGCILLGFMLSIGTAFHNSIPAAAVEKAPLVGLQNERKVVVNSSFISPLVELFGAVSVGQKVFIAGNTIVRADPETQVCLGNETNLQDNILFLALRKLPAPPSTCGKLASSTGDRVSIAHQAKIKNSKIGNFTFVGFHADLNNVVLEDGAFVLHGAKLTNVRIGKDRLVPIGAVITTQAQADALLPKANANAEFQKEVLEVNEEFAEHYSKLYEADGFDAVTGVSAAPKTSWNPEPIKPTLGQNVRLEEFARLVGNVRLGGNSVVGRRTSIRADEGAPIVIGENAAIEDRVTFHALKGSSIRIGNNLNTSDNVVFHGPLEVGNNLTIADDVVLFRFKVGNNVTIGTGAIVVGGALKDGTAKDTVGSNVTIGAGAIVNGVTLKDGANVPEKAFIDTQAKADALKT